MSQVMNTALSAILVAQSAIQNSAHNIANSKTDGFKKLEVQTSDLFYNNIKRAGIYENADSARRPVGAQIGTGSRIDGIYRVLEMGAPRATGTPLDIALVGPGYFAIALPNGRTGYTRNGAFQMDPTTRRIVTSRGEPLTEPEITIPDDVQDLNDITISQNGVVTAKNRANPGQADIDIGQIQLYTFSNERGLELGANNMLLETDASDVPIEVADQERSFLQKNLESSTVVAVDELTKMIGYQRLYELAMNYIKADSEMEKKLSEIS